MFFFPVHNLTPQDIKVVAGVGDSITVCTFIDNYTYDVFMLYTSVEYFFNANKMIQYSKKVVELLNVIKFMNRPAPEFRPRLLLVFLQSTGDYPGGKIITTINGVPIRTFLKRGSIGGGWVNRCGSKGFMITPYFHAVDCKILFLDPRIGLDPQ